LGCAYGVTASQIPTGSATAQAILPTKLTRRQSGENIIQTPKATTTASPAATSSKVAGSLYVREGDALLRISVGGPGDVKEKIARSKQLARKALNRL